MKKIVVAVLLLLVATSLLCSCSLTDIFGQAGITSPNSDNASTTENPAYETLPVGEKLTFDGITLSEHILLTFKGIELEVAKLPSEITDKMMQGQLYAMLDYYKEKEDFKYTLVTDRVTEEWDYVLIDYTGKIDGEAIDRGADTDAGLLLNEENSGFIPGFADGIIGKTPGTKFDISVTFPKDYGNKELAGKEAVFEINLKGIMEFEFTDKEASKLTSGKYTTPESYYEYYKDYLKQLEDYNLLNEVYPQIWEKLEATATVLSYPDEHYLYYYNSNVNYMIYQAKQLGVTYEEYMTATGQTDEVLKKKAEDSVKRDMIVYYILEAEGIKITDEDYDSAVQYYVDYYNEMGYNYKAEDIEKMFDTYYYPGYLRYQLAEEKALTTVFDAAVFVEKSADSTESEDTAEVTQ